MRFTVSGKTDTGARREANEDSIFFAPERAFALVADGMGGHRAGAIASEVSTQTITAYLEDCEEKGRLDESSVLQAVREANARVFWLSTEDEGLSGMGSTVSLIALSGSTAIVAHVGNSRIYLYRKGMLRRLTSDHSCLQEQVNGNIITEEQVRPGLRRHWILRTLGQGDQVEVDILRVKVRVNDLFVLCSDGLHTMVSDPEITEIVSRSELTPDRLCEDLVRAANQHGGEDNISVVAVRVDDVGATAVRPAIVAGAVFLCLLLSTGVLLRILPRSGNGGSGSTPVPTGDTEIARVATEVETAPSEVETAPAAEIEPVEQETPVPDVSLPEVVMEEPKPAEPSLANIKQLAQDRSLDKPIRVDAYKKAAVMCVAEENRSEARELLRAALALDTDLSFSADDALAVEVDEAMLTSLSEIVAEAKRLVYDSKRSASGVEATMKSLGDDARRYVGAARESLRKADDLAKAGKLPEALDRLAVAAAEVERALTKYRNEKTACREAVTSAQAQLASLEALERWNVKLLESDLEVIAASRNEMLRLSDRGEFRSAIDRASNIRKSVADIEAQAAANRKARQSAIDALDSAASLVSAVGTGLPRDYPAQVRQGLERCRRGLEDVRIMTAEGRFEEAQSTAGRVCEECKMLVGEMFQVLVAKRSSLLDDLPPNVADGVERAGLDSALAAANAVDSPPAEAVPELLSLFGVATEAMAVLDATVRDAIEQDAAWRREASRYLGEAETHIARVKERLRQAGGSDQAVRFWLDRCTSGPLTSLGEVSRVSEGFAGKVAELRAVVQSHTEKQPFRVSDSDIGRIEDLLEELRQIVTGGVA